MGLANQVQLSLLRMTPEVSLYPLRGLCPGTGRVRGTRKSRKGYQTSTYVVVWYPLRDFLVPLTRPVPGHRSCKGYKETTGVIRSRLNGTRQVGGQAKSEVKSRNVKLVPGHGMRKGYPG